LHAEVRERRKAEAHARAMADLDPLTGCLNRRSGIPAIEQLRLSALAEGRELAVFVLDLDNFKQINDLNGHQMGDHVLTATAHRIDAILPPGGLLARIGGDEFVCAITYRRADQADVDVFAQRVIETVSSQVEHDDMFAETTVSVGIASTAPLDDFGDADSAEMLTHRADIAMYHSKKRGRNCHGWFEPQMEEVLRFRNELETAIRQGIHRNEFVPYYEQQIDLETGELIGFEMLARWHSPRYGVVSPEVFIPVAEEIDCIGPMSEGLIRQALGDARRWHPRLTMSVNISPVQLRDPWFAQKILQLLVESGFPPQRLEIEITESCLHQNIGAVRAIVTSLKNQGIRLSLDDFGTGYSSLAQLRSLPFDRLKIDRSFIAELAEGRGGFELIEAIVSLGKGLQLPVMAEGVESTEVLAALKRMGGLNGQGFLYGQPEDGATTAARLAAMDLLVDADPNDTAPTGQEPLRHTAS